MDANQMLGEVREINLGYMLLAQQMLREDRTAAMYRLGIGKDVADIMENLTSSQHIGSSHLQELTGSEILHDIGNVLADSQPVHCCSSVFP